MKMTMKHINRVFIQLVLLKLDVTIGTANLDRSLVQAPNKDCIRIHPSTIRGCLVRGVECHGNGNLTYYFVWYQF